MMEKQNRQVDKTAAGDAGELDDIVEFASRKMEKSSGIDRKIKSQDGEFKTHQYKA